MPPTVSKTPIASMTIHSTADATTVQMPSAIDNRKLTFITDHGSAPGHPQTGLAGTGRGPRPRARLARRLGAARALCAPQRAAALSGALLAALGTAAGRLVRLGRVVRPRRPRCGLTLAGQGPGRVALVLGLRSSCVRHSAPLGVRGRATGTVRSSSGSGRTGARGSTHALTPRAPRSRAPCPRQCPLPWLRRGPRPYRHRHHRSRRPLPPHGRPRRCARCRRRRHACPD